MPPHPSNLHPQLDFPHFVLHLNVSDSASSPKGTPPPQPLTTQRKCAEPIQGLWLYAVEIRGICLEVSHLTSASLRGVAFNYQGLIG